MEEHRENINFEQTAQFELPEIGIRALEYVDNIELTRQKPEQESEELKLQDNVDLMEQETPDEDSESEETEETESEENSEVFEDIEMFYEEDEEEGGEQEESKEYVSDMLDILNKQAKKTHQQDPFRPPEVIIRKPGPENEVGTENKSGEVPDAQSIDDTTTDKEVEEKSDEQSTTSPPDEDPREKAKKTAELLVAQPVKGAEVQPDIEDDYDASRAKARETARILAEQAKNTSLSDEAEVLPGVTVPRKKYSKTRTRPVKKEETYEEKIARKIDKSVPKDLLDEIAFLVESIDQYEKYVGSIGRNGLAAVNIGYYRDDIQDILDLLKYEEDLNLKPYWERIVKLDLQLRAKAPQYVREVGHENFKQYQIINDPPHVRWWWYLNRIVAPPMIQPKFWEIWKKI